MQKLMLPLLTSTVLLAATGASAATLNVVGGELLGAFDVDVDGSLYDVEFVDGTCIGLYSGCDDVSDFTFQTEASALLAAQALLDDVFVGAFDTDSSLVNGCDSVLCSGLTPYASDGVGFSFVAAENQDVLLDIVGTPGSLPIAFDSSATSTVVFAVWSPVPEPTTALLMGGGLLVLSVRRRWETAA